VAAVDVRMPTSFAIKVCLKARSTSYAGL
jgi:hypothetical protein